MDQVGITHYKRRYHTMEPEEVAELWCLRILQMDQEELKEKARTTLLKLKENDYKIK